MPGFFTGFPALFKLVSGAIQPLKKLVTGGNDIEVSAGDSVYLKGGGTSDLSHRIYTANGNGQSWIWLDMIGDLTGDQGVAIFGTDDGSTPSRIEFYDLDIRLTNNLIEFFGGGTSPVTHAIESWQTNGRSVIAIKAEDSSADPCRIQVYGANDSAAPRRIAFYECDEFVIQDEYQPKFRYLPLTTSWNMDTTASATIAHGVDAANIVGCSVVVHNNASTNVVQANGVAAVSSDNQVGYIIGSTNISLARYTGGFTDDPAWNAATAQATLFLKI
jgi:hypothetical protein